MTKLDQLVPLLWGGISQEDGSLPVHSPLTQVLVGSTNIRLSSHSYVATVPYGRPPISVKILKSYEMEPLGKAGRSAQAPNRGGSWYVGKTD